MQIEEETRGPTEEREEGTTAGEAEPAPTPTSAPPWAPSPPQVHRYKDADGVAEAAAKRFLDSAKRAVHRSGRFIVVLSGGSTPRRLYEILADSPYRESVPWQQTLFLFGDERCVDPDDEASNYRLARETLFEPLEIPSHRVLRMKGEQKPNEAAQRYEVRLGDVFLGEKKRHFDLVLLGIGTDGHTASLFPDTAALEETERWVVANEVPQLDTTRLTMTFPALSSARRIIYMATGEEKAQVIAEAFGGFEHDAPYPCERVLPRHAPREVLIDREAASRIPAAPAAEAEAAETEDAPAGD
jgi:6-phosphogluconolactonase